jgi:hypothetical protein
VYIFCCKLEILQVRYSEREPVPWIQANRSPLTILLSCHVTHISHRLSNVPYRPHGHSHFLLTLSTKLTFHPGPTSQSLTHPFQRTPLTLQPSLRPQRPRRRRKLVPTQRARQNRHLFAIFRRHCCTYLGQASNLHSLASRRPAAAGIQGRKGRGWELCLGKQCRG